MDTGYSLEDLAGVMGDSDGCRESDRMLGQIDDDDDDDDASHHIKKGISEIFQWKICLNKHFKWQGDYFI